MILFFPHYYYESVSSKLVVFMLTTYMSPGTHTLCSVTFSATSVQLAVVGCCSETSNWLVYFMIRRTGPAPKDFCNRSVFVQSDIYSNSSSGSSRNKHIIIIICLDDQHIS